ncbi:Haloacid dehalogenase-like hydrolase domain-containing protein 2 [Cladochytrium tenue]|nr:Haloacid dehalogenase-like hydrolase domain-containing protein 2 [Cladochytrium tenue]
MGRKVFRVCQFHQVDVFSRILGVICGLVPRRDLSRPHETEPGRSRHPHREPFSWSVRPSSAVRSRDSSLSSVVSAIARKKATMSPIRGVLVDLSGTLHIENLVTRDAVAALGRLRQAGLQVRFVSNTTKESSARLLSRLRVLGFADVRSEELFTSLTAARALLVSQNLRAPLLLLSPEAVEEFPATDLPGAVVLPQGFGGPGGGGDTATTTAVAAAAAACDAVVVGLAPEQLAYWPLTAAMRVLQAGGAFVALHRGRYFQRADGQLALGPGGFVAALEFATGRTAETVGKPEPAFFGLAVADMGLEPGELAMIGDDVRDDVGGAQALGMTGILVRTGKYRAGDETRHGVTPAMVVDDFAAAVDRILQSQ